VKVANVGGEEYIATVSAWTLFKPVENFVLTVPAGSAGAESINFSFTKNAGTAQYRITYTEGANTQTKDISSSDATITGVLGEALNLLKSNT
jgi:hypothetical protein